MSALDHFIANANIAFANNQLCFETPYSSLVLNILKLLYQKGMISSFSRISDRRVLVNLIQFKGKTFLSNISRISKPSRRFYSPLSKLIISRNGLYRYLYSTQGGILLGSDLLQMRKGGEVLLKFSF